MNLCDLLTFSEEKAYMLAQSEAVSPHYTLDGIHSLNWLKVELR